MVPCSTQSQFPYLWSAALHCTHGMAILGDPGADEMGVPSRSCNPRERNWEPLPIPPMSRPPPRAPRVSPAPAALPARSQPQWRPPGAQLGPTPTQSHLNLDPRSPGLPVPGALPASFQPQCPPLRAQLGSPPPPPPEADPRPTPPAFAPPLHGPGTFPASSVHARVGAGCRSMGDVSGA